MLTPSNESSLKARHEVTVERAPVLHRVEHRGRSQAVRARPLETRRLPVIVSPAGAAALVAFAPGDWRMFHLVKGRAHAPGDAVAHAMADWRIPPAEVERLRALAENERNER